MPWDFLQIHCPDNEVVSLLPESNSFMMLFLKWLFKNYVVIELVIKCYVSLQNKHGHLKVPNVSEMERVSGMLTASCVSLASATIYNLLMFTYLLILKSSYLNDVTSSK